jgi:drug/metabolite transporter (DMT)-like permease
MTHARPTVNEGRFLIVLAAVLWSLSGGFTKLLTQESHWTLGTQPLPGLAIAFYRALFAGLVLLPLVRRTDIAFRPLMIVLAGCFAAMNALFVLAMALGSAANAVLLQYTAPMWMYLASIWLLGERADRRSSISLAIGLAGIAIIIVGGKGETQLGVSAIALGSGFAYAGVILCLRALRGLSPRYLTVVDHLVGPHALFVVLGAAQARHFSAGGSVPVRLGADGAAILADDSGAARCQPAGGRDHNFIGTATQSGLGLPGCPGNGNAGTSHIRGRRLHPGRTGVALLATKINEWNRCRTCWVTMRNSGAVESPEAFFLIRWLESWFVESKHYGSLSIPPFMGVSAVAVIGPALTPGSRVPTITI